jgi:protein-tyrosine phosphatase
MRYVYWAIPELLAGRPGPDAFSWDLDELRDAGFGAVLSLHQGALSLASVSRQGFVHKLLAMPNSAPPLPEDARTCQRMLPEALAFIWKHTSRDVPIMVHCHSGKDRTGVVLVAYLAICLGVDIDAAITKLRTLKPSLLSAPGYEALAYEMVHSKHVWSAVKQRLQG